MGCGEQYTDDMDAWIQANLNTGDYYSLEHFTAVFNVTFGCNRTKGSMVSHLYYKGWQVKTYQNSDHWTPEMEKWLIEHFSKYNFSFVDMAADFNAEFQCNKTACCINKFLQRKGIHKPRPKKAVAPADKKDHPGNSKKPVERGLNRGCFKTGQKSLRGELPIGTIRYNGDGRPFIKVMLCEGEYRKKNTSGHNYAEPFWKPLQKKIWEDHYGEVPEGFIVCTLNGNPNDTDINHIGLIDKRATTRMAKNDWWGIDNADISRTAVQWCNLYYAEKDSEKKVL